MGSLRDVIEEAFRDLKARKPNFILPDLSDTILSALAAHFAQPGAVTDEMVKAAGSIYFAPTSWSKKTESPALWESFRRALAAALQKMR